MLWIPSYSGAKNPFHGFVQYSRTYSPGTVGQGVDPWDKPMACALWTFNQRTIPGEVNLEFNWRMLTLGYSSHFWRSTLATCCSVLMQSAGEREAGRDDGDGDGDEGGDKGEKRGGGRKRKRNSTWEHGCPLAAVQLLLCGIPIAISDIVWLSCLAETKPRSVKLDYPDFGITTVVYPDTFPVIL